MKKSIFLSVAFALGSLASLQAQTFVNYSGITGGTTTDSQWTNFVLPSGVSSGLGGNAGQWAATGSGYAANGGSTTNVFWVPQSGGVATNPSEYTDFTGGGIYTFFTQTDFTVSSTAALSGLKTFVLQLNVASGTTSSTGGAAADFSATGVPKLTLSISGGGTYTAQAATYSLLEETAITFVPAIGSTTPVNTWGYQWDLSGVTGTITGYTVNFESAYHTIYQGVDVTQSTSVINSNALTTVPEPSTYALMALGLGFLVYLRRRRTKA